MNIYMILAILLANIIAVAIVYQFIKRLSSKEKLVFIATSVAVIYILLTIIYWSSGFGIDEKIHEASKSFIIYLFVPINLILFIPFIASAYMKLKENKIKLDKFLNRCIKVVVIYLIFLVIQFFYFKNIQNNINNTISDMENSANQEENQKLNSIDNKLTNSITNEINTNINNIGNAISSNINANEINVTNNMINTNI